MRSLGFVTRLSALTIAAAGIAGCGGGGSSAGMPRLSAGAIAPPAPSAPAAASARSAQATFVMNVPSTASSSTRRAIKYLSPSTQSVAIIVGSGAPVVHAVTPSSPGCSTSGSTLSCPITLSVVPGSTTFTIATYASTDGTGTPLSRVTVTENVTSGSNVFPITMNGVVARLGLALSPTNFAAGTAATSTVSVLAYDASNNLIVGSGSYMDANGNALSIALGDSDGSGATKLSATSVGTPSNVQLSYNGSGGALSSSITATAGSMTASAPFTVSVPVAPQPLEQAKMADAFVDSVGINIHLTYTNTGYNNFSTPASSGNTINGLLQQLNVRHFRDGDQGTNQCPEYRTLASEGIHGDYLTAPSQQASTFSNWLSCVGGSADSFEAPNEYDNSGDPNWAATLRSFQPVLYNGAHAVNVSVIGPSLTSEGAYTSLGDLSGSLDYGNLHNYFSGFNPGTGGWGGTDALGTYGALSTDLNWAAQVSKSKPIITTESGYTELSADGGAYITPTVKTRYTTRLLLNQFASGVARTYVYELVNLDGQVPFSGYGLVDSSLNPKPAFKGMQSLMSTLKDPGSAFTPGSLSYSMTGVASNVRHVLMQKRDGTFWLAAWIEAPGIDMNSHATLSVPSQTATITFGQNVSRLTNNVINDDGTLASTSMNPATSLSWQLTDRVSILQISP